ncbi:Protein involved in meta-pathway of phenol degradation-like protein [Shewanella sediminis HAW-EB3]|uniref:Protein involved in meta-pathway of phenol degradation-like protein n=1 Tax=Shewanella sediminis (strain HAW-EB3) TaxID=425104 RepID=A8FU56_SHESH|nr:transporter [Shewanella sediminis]ABV36379.1 Protein involved in meta-pathway of phenol degradation-like protein [Shewanella sediminis HAW-EB3]
MNLINMQFAKTEVKEGLRASQSHQLKLLLALAMTGFVSPTFADGIVGAGHYAPAIANIRDLTVPDQAGFVYEQYNFYYTSDTLIASSGKEVSGDLSSGGIAPLFLWVTDREVMGARYSFYFNPVYLSNDLDGEEDQGLGDLYIQPVWLSWLNKSYDVTLGIGVYAPVGNEDVTLDMWTTQFQLAGYYYMMDQASALMLAATYEIHSEVDETKVTPGDHLTIEYGWSQYFTQQFEVGIRGYSQWQMQRDDLPSNLNNLNQLLGTDIGNKSEVHGVGIQAAYWFNNQWNLAFNYAKEYSAESRFEGEMYSLNITYMMN